MSDFTTRIDLQGADTGHYEALDKAMGAANFSKTVRSSFGFDYALPVGTYFSQSFTMSAADVRNLAMVCAHQIGLPYDIVTTAGEVAYFLHPARGGAPSREPAAAPPRP